MIESEFDVKAGSREIGVGGRRDSAALASFSIAILVMQRHLPLGVKTVVLHLHEIAVRRDIIQDERRC